MGSKTESHLDFYRRWHRLAAPYFRWQFEQFEPHIGRRVADIGCGLGNLTRFMLDRELYVGVDPDYELLGEMERRYGDMKNVEALSGDIVDPRCRDLLIGKKLDTIICVNVLEHIKDDTLALKNMASALPSGGTLCLLVPAMPSIFGTLDRLDGHVRRYSKRDLSRKLCSLPLTIVKFHYFNFMGAFGWWWKGRVLKKERQSNSDYKLMNLFIPLMSRMEKALAPPLGLSLVAVAKRR